MQPFSSILSARRSIELQATSIAALTRYLTPDFEKALDQLIKCKGRLVISGIGKSAIIAQKIVATLNSTGTPSLFMHAADAIHGDLGMIQEQDVVIVISKSGDSPEIKVLAPLVKSLGNVLVGMVGNMKSYLALHSDFIINTTVEQEACPHNLAPTTSTTAQMVMGDALAICLMEAKGFQSSDFARFHPGGMLGKKLYLRVADLIDKEAIPAVGLVSSIKQVIIEITKKRLGATAVLDDEGMPAGIITDGDIRRMLENYDNFAQLKAADIMSKNPKMIEAQEMAAGAMEAMQQNKINQLLVMQNGLYAGIIHIQALMKEGIF